MQSKISSYRPLLGQKQYLKLIGATLFGRFGDSIDVIAFSWIMYQVTGSASMIALILAINYLPSILLQPFAGVLVDRLPKRRVMALCDAGRALAIGATAALYLGGLLSPGVLIAVTLVESTLESFRMPAGNAVLPRLLDREFFTVGTALKQTCQQVMQLLGTAAAGGIVALWGSPAALFVDGACFLGSAIFVSLLRFRDPRDETPFTLGGYGRRLAEGFRYLKTKRILVWLTVLGALMNLSMTPLSAFMSAYVAEDLRMGPEALSIISISLTIGMGIGAFFTPRLLKRVSGRVVALGFGLLGACNYFVYGLLPALQNPWVIGIFLALSTCLLMGIGGGAQNVVFGSSFIGNTDPDLLGRISAIFNALLLCMMPLGSFICSGLAGVLPVPVIFLGFGAFAFLVYAAGFFVRPLREL